MYTTPRVCVLFLLGGLAGLWLGITYGWRQVVAGVRVSFSFCRRFFLFLQSAWLLALKKEELAQVERRIIELCQTIGRLDYEVDNVTMELQHLSELLCEAEKDLEKDLMAEYEGLDEELDEDKQE